ncbi:hypothetical protein EBU95_13945, partial [bacterium]|nr:hypothetical protein [bacterium]
TNAGYSSQAGFSIVGAYATNAGYSSQAGYSAFGGYSNRAGLALGLITGAAVPTAGYATNAGYAAQAGAAMSTVMSANSNYAQNAGYSSMAGFAMVADRISLQDSISSTLNSPITFSFKDTNNVTRNLTFLRGILVSIS